jgi:DNA-binding NtrC family response regulator
MTDRILLVDDEPEFLEIMRERLENRDIIVDTSSSAEEAFQKIQNQLYDAVILDLKMPGIDGMQALTTIREKRPELQVILLTGHATLEKGIEAMKSGALDFIEKPADLEVLREKIMDAKNKKMMILEKMEKDKIIDAIRRWGV